MNHGVDVENNQNDDENDDNEDSPGQQRPNLPTQGSAARDLEWVNELRRAEERSAEIRLRCEDFKKSNSDLESRIKLLDDGIEKRDLEILRLGQLYQGGQNNDKLAA